jgi:HEAT repeat protein
MPNDARVALGKALRSGNRSVRDAAVEALCRARPADAGLVADISSLLDDPNEPSRRRAARALGELGEREAVPYLVRAVDDRYETFYVRLDAAEALVRLGQMERPLAFAIARSRSPYYPFGADAIKLLGAIARQDGPAEAREALLEVARSGACGRYHPEKAAAERELALLANAGPRYPHATQVSPVYTY